MKKKMHRDMVEKKDRGAKIQRERRSQRSGERRGTVRARNPQQVFFFTQEIGTNKSSIHLYSTIESTNV